MTNKTLYNMYSKIRKKMKYKDSFWINRKAEIASTTCDCMLEHELPNGKYYTHNFRIDDWRDAESTKLAKELDYLIQYAVDVTCRNMENEQASKIDEVMEGEIIN